MSSEWKEYIIKDVCSEITDCVNKTAPTVEYETPYKMIRTTNVSDGIVDLQNVKYVEEEVYEKWTRRIVPQKNDIILTREAPLGRVGLLRSEEKVFLGQRTMIYRAKPNVLDQLFLFYSLQSNYLQTQILALGSGSTVQHIRVPEAENLKIKLPPLPTQRRIAAILSALDDKIELNRRMNQTLEAIAQAIFREWFVRFNFPGATGEMVETEVGEVPKGWRVGKVSDVCEVNQNSISKDDSFDWIDYVEISGVSQGTISNVTRYEFGEQPSRARRKLKHGDVVLSTVRPSRGSYFLAIKPASTTIVSTGFAVFTPTHAPYGFLYLFLTDDKKLEYYGHVADGGAYPAIRPELIMEMDLVIPDDETLTVFQEVIEPFFETISKNLEESQTLTQVRDRLLPKLMRGEVEVV